MEHRTRESAPRRSPKVPQHQPKLDGQRPRKVAMAYPADGSSRDAASITSALMWYMRLKITVLDPPAGIPRTWRDARTQVVSGDSQESLYKMVRDEEQRTKLEGHQILNYHSHMTPEKQGQIQRLLTLQNNGEPDSRFRWELAMVKFNFEKQDGTGKTFTRSMDVIIRRKATPISNSPSHHATLPIAYPTAMIPSSYYHAPIAPHPGPNVPPSYFPVPHPAILAPPYHHILPHTSTNSLPSTFPVTHSTATLPPAPNAEPVDMVLRLNDQQRVRISSSDDRFQTHPLDTGRGLGRRGDTPKLRERVPASGYSLEYPVITVKRDKGDHYRDLTSSSGKDCHKPSRTSLSHYSDDESRQSAKSLSDTQSSLSHPNDKYKEILPPLPIKLDTIEEEIQYALAFDTDRRVDMSHGEHNSLGSFSNDLVRTWNVDIDWEFPQYVIKEMSVGQRLGDMVVASGDLQNAWMTQCKDYTNRFTDIGPVVLDLFEKVVEDFDILERLKLRSTKLDAISPPGSKLLFCPRPNKLLMEITNTHNNAKQILELIAWFAATFRPFNQASDSNNLVDEAETQISKVTCTRLSGRYIRVGLHPLELSAISTCWQRVYRGICSPQFHAPLRPKRLKDSGAELSLDLLLILAGVKYPLLDHGVIMFRGFQRLLFPVSTLDKTVKHIRWHIMIWETDEEEEKFMEDCWQLAARVLDKALDGSDAKINMQDIIMSLRDAKHYLGYSSKVETTIGTRKFPPQNPNQTSGAVPERSRLLFQKKKVVVNMGTSGLGIFGVGAGLEFGFTTSLSAKLNAGSGVHRDLYRSAKRPLLLYDVGQKVAYLVSELSVVLHIAQSWLCATDDLRAGEDAKIPYIAQTPDGGACGSVAHRCILSNEELRLERSVGKPLSFMELITSALEALKACRETTENESTTAHRWARLGFDAPRIYGWDLADIVADFDVIDRHETALDVNRHDLWISRIAHNRKMLTLFCKNIEPPIRVTDDVEMCARWSPVPTGKNYLLSSNRVLQHLILHLRGDDSLQQLDGAADCFLEPLDRHQPFVSCWDKSGSCCRRLHTIVSDRARQPQTLPKDGAVLIGTKEVFRSKKCKFTRAEDRIANQPPLLDHFIGAGAEALVEGPKPPMFQRDVPIRVPEASMRNPLRIDSNG